MLSVSGFLTAGLAALALSLVPVAQAQQNHWVKSCKLGIVACDDCGRNIDLAQRVYRPGAGRLFIEGIDLAKLRTFCGKRGIPVGAASFC
ncbi:uncharacterized protein UV8b_03653 [Ustilaginoidea virens]|uniref:Uncharacterized protein n=1 Tax=Ustilaginoidea virens TaxID=1159556 RepID=A0A063C4L1_USTVR|nr:uncharacterized protein UV8b_03653 [Ustilaginoidea virens]QUC19412.1 hypothetical protein UV8b_03653 [Ustilaginoidea virens]GAO13238.1 hypothetical protein UVI_02025850 [Ustilaginoidea virens]